MNTFFRIRVVYLPRFLAQAKERVFGIYLSQEEAFHMAFDSRDLLLASFEHEMRNQRELYWKTQAVAVDEYTFDTESEVPEVTIVRSWGEKLRG